MLGDWDLDGYHYCQLPRSCSSYKIPIIESCYLWSGFPGSSVGKESACSTGDLASIPGSGRSPIGGRDQDHRQEKGMQKGKMVV